MKRKIFSFLAIGAIGLITSVAAIAQDERNSSAVSELYVISAKAGGVNFVQGKVALTKNTRSGYLVKGDRLEIGERVSTDTNGRAEILLNPGSYVRLGANTEFEFVSTSLENLIVRLNRGSAMFELIADDEFDVMIETPKGKFKAVKSGVYGVDVLADGSGKLFVWEGRAEVVDANGTKIKESRFAVVNGNSVSVEKFDRDDKGELELWSKARAKELAKINSKLRREDLRNALLNSYNRRGWGFYDSFGLWAFDRISGQWCFVPFGYGWGSPYGYYYGRDLWYFRLPRYVYYYPTVRNPNTGNPTGTNNTPAATNRTRGERNQTPPFQRVNPGTQRSPRTSPTVIPAPTRPIRQPVLIPRTPSPSKGKPNN